MAGRPADLLRRLQDPEIREADAETRNRLVEEAERAGMKPGDVEAMLRGESAAEHRISTELRSRDLRADTPGHDAWGRPLDGIEDPFAKDAPSPQSPETRAVDVQDPEMDHVPDLDPFAEMRRGPRPR